MKLAQLMTQSALTITANECCVIGWDVGGAHLKAVQLNTLGQVIAVSQVYCPLWRGLSVLEGAISQVFTELEANTTIAAHFVTMTAELVDIFPNRQAGVMQIAQLLRQKLAGELMFYAGKQGFVDYALVKAHSADIASMNWLASVELVAHHRQQALFVDIGSTTTDIALIRDGKAQVQGFNDATRLQTDELVYSGVVRTPLMAVAQKISFLGHQVNVTAEHFATTADVYTLTGDLPPAGNMAETADGAEKSEQASARRIARMIGWDAQDASLSDWRALAYAFKQKQLQQIKQAILSQINLTGDVANLCIVGAGVGDFLVCELAQKMGLQYEVIANLTSVGEGVKLVSEIKKKASICFPAYAVAFLGMTSRNANTPT